MQVKCAACDPVPAQALSKMDFLMAAEARALDRVDPLAVLLHVSRRDDSPVVALRGIAMAQRSKLPAGAKCPGGGTGGQICAVRRR